MVLPISIRVYNSVGALVAERRAGDPVFTKVWEHPFNVYGRGGVYEYQFQNVDTPPGGPYIYETPRLRVFTGFPNWFMHRIYVVGYASYPAGAFPCDVLYGDEAIFRGVDVGTHDGIFFDVVDGGRVALAGGGGVAVGGLAVYLARKRRS